jgi:hypothetical protein
MQAPRAILGVEDDADAAEITRAWRTRSRRYHPDKRSDGCDDSFKQVTEARNALVQDGQLIAIPVIDGHDDKTMIFDELIKAPHRSSLFSLACFIFAERCIRDLRDLEQVNDDLLLDLKEKQRQAKDLFLQYPNCRCISRFILQKAYKYCLTTLRACLSSSSSSSDSHDDFEAFQVSHETLPCEGKYCDTPSFTFMRQQEWFLFAYPHPGTMRQMAYDFQLWCQMQVSTPQKSKVYVPLPDIAADQIQWEKARNIRDLPKLFEPICEPYQTLVRECFASFINPTRRQRELESPKKRRKRKVIDDVEVAVDHSPRKRRISKVPLPETKKAILSLDDLLQRYPKRNRNKLKSFVKMLFFKFGAQGPPWTKDTLAVDPTLKRDLYDKCRLLKTWRKKTHGQKLVDIWFHDEDTKCLQAWSLIQDDYSQLDTSDFPTKVYLIFIKSFVVFRLPFGPSFCGHIRTQHGPSTR